MQKTSESLSDRPRILMKVTLCYPALVPGKKPTYGLQPLGVLYIGALLKREGFDVQILDAEIEGLTVHETARRILDTNPDLVGFSMMTPQLITGLAASVLIKQERPDLPIVMGGAHVDSTKGDIFEMQEEHADCFDMAVHGEGEYTLAEICHNMETLGAENPQVYCKDVQNAIYRDVDGTVVVNPPRAFNGQLDDLPSVDFDMLDVKQYSIPSMPGRHVLSMMLSRGCPFKCTFCDAPMVMGKKIRWWSIERIIRDIAFYKQKYGISNFSFRDSTFTANKKWTVKFCEALLDANLNIKWRINTRASLVPPDLLPLMAKAGCYTINFGVESGHPDILKRIKKEVALDDVIDAFERCRKLGVRTYATFMMGNPGETDETALATLEFSKKIRPALAMFFVSTAYPGTPMYFEGLDEGTVKDRWWAKQHWDPTKNTAFQVRWGWTDAGALDIPGFDAEYWQQRATREWYLRPRFIWDTITFTVMNPHFMRHIWNLSGEILPFYKLRNLLPQRKLGVDERLEILAKCPSQPTVTHRERPGTVDAATAYGASTSGETGRGLPVIEN